jgi:hypothetical protein
MVGGPASSIDNAIARFDGTTGKVVQNSQYAIVDDNGAVTFGVTPSSGSSALSHTFQANGSVSVFLNTSTHSDASPLLRFKRGGSDRASIGVAGAGTGAIGSISSPDDFVIYTNGYPFKVSTNTAASAALSITTSGAVTLGPSSGFGLIHKLISNSKLLIGDTGSMEFRDRADTVTLGSVHTTTGAWAFGTSSGTTEFGHSMTGYRTTATTSVLYIRNRETTTASDDAYDIICNKGSTTNTSSQGFIAFYVNDGGTPSGHITANGAGAATFNAFSDLRLKENIQPLQGELLKILSLNPVEFDYKDGSGHQIGFIAQEVEQVYPDTINVLGVTEKMKTIAGWDKTSARLVKAIQELKAELDVAKARIEALENP